MKKALVCVLVLSILAVLEISGCSSGGGEDKATNTADNNPSTSTGNDPGSNTGNNSGDNTGTNTGDNTGNTTGALRVRVVNYDKIRVPNATVVLGDSNGAMITYGTTDANGEITFTNPPANATITSAMTSTACGDGYRHFMAFYDVNVSAITMGIDDCGTAAISTLGTITVNVTNLPSGTDSVEISAGGANGYAWGSDISNNQTQKVLTIYPSDLQSDGKVSLIATVDQDNVSISYGLLLDQTFTPGMTATISANQSFTNTVQFQLTNIPATMIGLSGLMYQHRKNSSNSTSAVNDWNLTSTATSTTISAPYIPGFQESCVYDVSVHLDRDNNGSADASMGFQRGSGPAGAPSNQTIDFSQMPVVPSNLAVSAATGTATPTFSWSGTDAGAYAIWGDIMIAQNTYFGFDAPPTRTSIVFPELPSSLNALRPSVTPQFFRLENQYDTRFSNYNDILSKIEQYYAGTWDWNGSAYTSKWSMGEWRSGTNLVPALNKAVAPTVSRHPTKRFGR